MQRVVAELGGAAEDAAEQRAVLLEVALEERAGEGVLVGEVVEEAAPGDLGAGDDLLDRGARRSPWRGSTPRRPRGCAPASPGPSWSTAAPRRLYSWCGFPVSGLRMARVARGKPLNSRQAPGPSRPYRKSAYRTSRFAAPSAASTNRGDDAMQAKYRHALPLNGQRDLPDRWRDRDDADLSRGDRPAALRGVRPPRDGGGPGRAAALLRALRGGRQARPARARARERDLAVEPGLGGGDRLCARGARPGERGGDRPHARDPRRRGDGGEPDGAERLHRAAG